jgi:hypothetical protein
VFLLSAEIASGAFRRKKREKKKERERERMRGRQETERKKIERERERKKRKRGRREKEEEERGKGGEISPHFVFRTINLSCSEKGRNLMHEGGQGQNTNR